MLLTKEDLRVAFGFNKKHKPVRTMYDRNKRVKMENYTFLSKNFCKRGQTVLVGDSITEICNVTDLFASYTEKTGMAVYNRGISGDTSDRLLERIRDNVTCLKPTLIVLLIGTNDLGFGLDTDFTANNVDKILDVFDSDCKDAKVILQAVYPVNSHVDPIMVGKRKNKDICEMNAKLKEIAEKHKVVFADFTDLLSDEHGRFNREYTYDGLHPNAVGFSVVTGELLKMMGD